MQAIVDGLRSQGFISEQDATRLRACPNSRAFLQTAISLYEGKANLYLEACAWDVKRELQAQPNQQAQQTLEKTIEAAHDAFFEMQKVAFLPSLRAVLVRSSPDLLVSLGLKAVNEANDNLVDVARRVFVAYTARHRLFQAVDKQALLTLCQETDTGEEAPFPVHLYSAFQVENELSQQVRGTQNAASIEERARFMAAQVQGNIEPIIRAVQGVLFYLGTVLKGANISETLKDRYFRHLNTPELRMQFINLVAPAYVQELCQEARQLELARDASRALLDKIHQVCLPALTLLDMQVTVDTSRWSSEVNRLNQALQANQNATGDIARQAEEARRQAREQIDRWRANVPQREITFGLQYGFRI